MVQIMVVAFILGLNAGAAIAAEKPEIRIEDLLKLFQTKVADADAIKCAKLEDALELAEIFAKDGVNGLAENKRDGCELLDDIGTHNRDPAKLAKASVKVHPKNPKAPVYELTGKSDFVEEDEDVTVYVLLLKPAR